MILVLAELIIAIAVPAILVVVVPQHWLKRAQLTWLISPAILYVVIIFWEMLTRPAMDHALGNAFFGFLLSCSLLAIPWFIACLVGFGLGYVLRRELRPAQAARATAATVDTRAGAPSAASSKNSANPVAPQVVATANWRNIHIGFENDGLRIGGLQVWQEKWRRIAEESVQLPHPTYPTQIHRYDIFDIGDGEHPIRFAAGELSNGVWGFYVPTTYPVESQGMSIDGSLRYEHRIGEFANGRYDSVSNWAVLIETSSDLVLVDCAAWASSQITPNADGSLLLHLQQNSVDALFWIDPKTRQFRNHGDRGPRQALAVLADAVEQARRAISHAAPVPLYRRISPDGTIRVDLVSVEWGNTHWVNSPQVMALESGRIVLDLWSTDWDAAISFPGYRRVRLNLRRYHAGGNLTVDLDIGRGTYQIVAEPGHEGALAEAPLTEIISGIEASARRVAVLAVSRGVSKGLRANPISPHPLAAWRQALLILLGAILAIALASFVSVHFFPTQADRPVPLQVVPQLNIAPSSPQN